MCAGPAKVLLLLQGCNTALESCAVLDSVLDRTSTPEQV